MQRLQVERAQPGKPENGFGVHSPAHTVRPEQTKVWTLVHPSIVANLSSRSLLHEAIASFRRHAAFPSEGVAAPAFVPGVDWSDHRSFWEQGYPALMITDTAPYRYPHYHTMQDTPDKVDYERLARVVTGLDGMLRDLANP